MRCVVTPPPLLLQRRCRCSSPPQALPFLNAAVQRSAVHCLHPSPQHVAHLRAQHVNITIQHAHTGCVRMNSNVTVEVIYNTHIQRIGVCVDVCKGFRLWSHEGHPHCRGLARTSAAPAPAIKIKQQNSCHNKLHKTVVIHTKGIFVIF
jgi:hypothetical protein